MENAVDALKMAFAVVVFVLAIAIAFGVFSQARRVSDLVLYENDKTNFEEYVPEHTATKRTVGMEAVIPAVRRYLTENENYSVTIVDGSTVYEFDLLEDEGKNLTEMQIKARLEESLNTLLKKYAGATFIETYEEIVYRGGINDNVIFSDGETVEKVNTDTKVKITYTKQ